MSAANFGEQHELAADLGERVGLAHGDFADRLDRGGGRPVDGTAQEIKEQTAALGAAPIARGQSTPRCAP